MAAQAAISAARLRAKVGTHAARAGRRASTDGTAIARSTADAPEIDGTVRIADAADLAPGTFARVRITRADAHDLHAEIT